MNTQRISPQGYNINIDPMNNNPFWETEPGTGGNVPAGGTAGQVLTKRTAEDYDTYWSTPESGGADWPAGGNNGDLLTKSGTGAAWVTPTYAQAADLEELEAEVDTKADAADLTALAGRVSTAEDDIDNILTMIQDFPSDERIDALEADVDNLATIVDGLGATQTVIINNATALTERVTTLETGLTAETTARTNADTALAAEDTRLAGLISAEATARADADALIRSDLGDEIDDEAEARAASDTALQTAVTTEAGTRAAADASLAQEDTRLAGLISDEATARAAADTALQAQLSGLHTIPAGGTTGQALTKVSGTDYDVGWSTIKTGEDLPPIGVSGGTEYSKQPGYMTSSIIDNIINTYHLGMIGSWDANKNAFIYRWTDQSLVKFNREGILGTTNFIPAISSYSNGLLTLEPSKVLSLGRTAAIHDGCLFVGKTTGASQVGGNATETDPVSGGTTGQVLTKSSNNDYDWEWTTPSSGSGDLPTGGLTGQLLQMSAIGDPQWWTPNYATSSDFNTLAGDLADEVTARQTLAGRVTTAEGNITGLYSDLNDLEDAIEAEETARISAVNTLTAAETAIAARVTSLETDTNNIDVITTPNNVYGLTGSGPTFLALPWLDVDKFGIVQEGSENAPDAWAIQYSGSSAQGNYNTNPVIFDCDIFPGQGSMAFNSANYGTGASNKIYVPYTTGVSSACQRTFSLGGSTGETSEVELTLTLHCNEVNSLNVSGRVTASLLKSQYAGETTTVYGKFHVTASGVDYVRGGGPDFIAVFVNNGAGSYVCRVGFCHDFFRWIGINPAWTNAYRWTVSSLDINKIMGRWY